MTGVVGPDDGIVFAQKLLTLLDEGSFATTYKYGVLLALLDCCLEYAGGDGTAPTSLTTRQVADAALGLYWQHAAPFSDDTLLRQSGTGQAEVVTLIHRYRAQRHVDPFAPLGRCRTDDPAGIDRLLDEVEWKLVEMPLPRLQKLSGTMDAFIYTIGWEEGIKPSEWKDGATFPNTILFVEGAAAHLLRFAPLLRPLIQRQWASKVARLNPGLVQDAGLEAFLFGHTRIPLKQVGRPLRDLQDNRCFYCDARLGVKADVDHFLPWARHPDNGIHNLVAAHPGCNNSKRDFLAAAAHVDRWTARSTGNGPDLDAIASAARWEAQPRRTLTVARAMYLPLTPDARLWQAREEFVAADMASIRRSLKP